MNSLLNLPDPEVIESEACAWLAQVDGGAMSEGDMRALREWIGRSPLHRRTFERMAAHFVLLHDPLDILEPAGNPPEEAARQRRLPRLAPTFIGLAAAAAAAIFGIYLAAPPLLDRSAPAGFAAASDIHISRVGEQKTVGLADGSELMLNTNTRVRVTLSETERAVELIKGEALFEVAKDPDRPFRVYTPHGVVKAIGTVFTVRVDDNAVEVVVEEGVVELAQPEPEETGPGRSTGGPAPTRLSSGKLATMSAGVRAITELDGRSMGRKLAWRQGMLVFDFDPLGYVVEEVSRYTDVKIVISDPKILSLPIGGNFRVGETDALLDALEKGFGIRVERVGDGLVYLSPQA